VSEPLVIVGNGMARGATGRGLTRCRLDEPRLAYNRVLLSSVRAGETAPEDIELKPMWWWRDRGVTLTVGCSATEIDVGRRKIKIANHESVSFSRLVLATGPAPLRCARSGSSHPANLPLKHRERHRSNFHRRSARRIDEVIE
jgi:nitrite reductase (NADH) large subunit